ncbi:DegT/DnrJ/EryC1/StrS family aminotransferase [Cohnella sp. JJ-181]|uniref:DegT/DnrJ/EryC1/StrS family aminotransferase n=1 Tax=Cohnella rhizoplanae TaxID=2974897 RepID=UPI00233056C4|nr:DegT/DnrJ/EryC1/StrS family aminotransferase [Cohnella sp. JJ-181]
MSRSERLALLGGTKAITDKPGDLFTWPIITEEDEAAALDVLRRGVMSGTEITMQFEQEFGRWMDVPYALAFNNGTASLQAAMYGCGIGVGEEIIGPSITYWASALQAFSLGATAVFADIDPVTLCLDPRDIERRIGERTKAIMVVHYLGHPADMDAIMRIADRYGLKVIEDVSHAHGGLYRGRKLGSIGHVGAMSLMAGKALAVGEGGMLTTSDRTIYERAVALGHYDRFNAEIADPALAPYRDLPLGGYKYRMHQISSAVGRVQLKHYDARHAEIGRAMNRFWDLLDGVPGIRAHRPDKDAPMRTGGWYAARGHYKSEELGGLSVTRFCEAVRAEGVDGCHPGCNLPLHRHALLQTADVYGHGKPTRIATAVRDVRQLDDSLPVSEEIARKVFSVPWFKHDRPDAIEAYAMAFRKVAENYRELLPGDRGNPRELGGWSLYRKK